MKNLLPIAACASALFAAGAQAAGPFDAFKGKVKEGLYETKMDMEIPGMPGGMGKQQMTFQNCVSAKDIEAGQMGKDDKNAAKDCEVKDFKMSGNTASYTTVCTGATKMTADTKVTFRDNGYSMDMKMSMNEGGQVMKMAQKMDARYVGPCKK